MKPYWQRQQAIEDLEIEVEELRDKNEDLEDQVYTLESQCKGFEIETRQIWESIDTAFGSITNLKEKYNEKN